MFFSIKKGTKGNLVRLPSVRWWLEREHQRTTVAACCQHEHLAGGRGAIILNVVTVSDLQLLLRASLLQMLDSPLGYQTLSRLIGVLTVAKQEDSLLSLVSKDAHLAVVLYFVVVNTGLVAENCVCHND